MRLQRSIVGTAAGCLAVALALPIGGTGAASAAPPSALSGKTPQQILTIVVAAEKAQGSCLWGENFRWGGWSVHSTTHSGVGKGNQTIAGTLWGNGTVLVVSPKMAYGKGDAKFLETQLSLTAGQAAKHVGQWISIPSSSPSFASFTGGLTLSSVTWGAKLVAPLRLTKSATVDGKRVVGVSGWAPDFTKGKVTDTLYVATAAPNLPVELVQHGTANGYTFAATDPFLGWGEAVSVTAPSKAIPLSSINAP
jgi:hypothetical protein